MAGIGDIDGISPRHAQMLASVDIRSSDRLLEYGATKKGRRELSKVTGLGEKRILEWIKRADLIRVQGIHTRYSDLLETVGVDSVKDLRRRNAKKLLVQMQKVNKRRKVVVRLPTETEVQRWITSAKDLPVILH